MTNGNDKLIARQGSIVPTLFIGLGGVGSRIVDRIADRARHLPNWDSQMRPLTAFLSIDTDDQDQHRLKNIPNGNRINIAGFDKAKVIEGYRRSRDIQALQWLDPAYQPRGGFKQGAGQIRVESRLAYFYYSSNIRQRLNDIVDNLLQPGVTWRQSDPPKFNVYLYCTLAGGTGSGSFLSVAYLLNRVIRDHHWQPRVMSNLLLSTLLTDKVGPELHRDIHANTYAALKELEHLTKLDYTQVKQEGREFEAFMYFRDENRCGDEDERVVIKVDHRPFFMGYLFDRAPHMDLPNVEHIVADAAYLQTFSPIIERLSSELDNYEKRLEELTRFPGDLKNVGLGYAKHFGAFGAVAMVLPGKDLLEYCALRFASQALRRQITFGIDEGASDDDRARALARYAVNYGDPKFLRLSDAARERKINDAFVSSVQEMARQDEREELTDGVWYQLVGSVDEGPVKGLDNDGQPIRGESLIDAIGKQLDNRRRDLLNKVSIKERAFVFHREGVNQYIEYVSRLSEDIRRARVLIDEGVKGLEMAAREGEAVLDLKLDPIQERYLVLRLLDRCENTWLPAAEQALDKAKGHDINNTKVRERLERELFQLLQTAATKKRFLRRDDTAFESAKNEAQEYYRRVAAAARNTFEAEACLRQLRELTQYLHERTRQYARLATRMDTLVRDLDTGAERLRRGEDVVVPPYALRVEVFETLAEPRTRMWGEIYERLFIAKGRHVATFDRKVLAQVIAEQLKPVVTEDGSVRSKTDEQTVGDLRRAMLALGRERLASAIFGSDDQPGLDLMSGLDLEARIRMEPSLRPGETLGDDAIMVYREKKFRALAQLAGVLARVNTSEAQAEDDGVVVNRTRLLIHGLDQAGRGAEAFQERLESVLSTGGRQVKLYPWPDPHLVIVHDVDHPIPLYYFMPVVGEIENAYLEAASDDRRAYFLHTDKNWEKSLPNLNPRRSEITVGWALMAMAQGLITGVVLRQKDTWIWLPKEGGKIDPLGENLSIALYRLARMHAHKELREAFDERLQAAENGLSSDDRMSLKEAWVQGTKDLLSDMGRREIAGKLTREDILDRPILRTLLGVLRGELKMPESERTFW
uniref:Tubulin like n=1 Tax=Candidatus Kentrum sp. UNK TaxID=2126344 RepID=A0A450ZWC3_9GAMM|nr:MAG: Tubulin like [Candidatus Kentron sp. UNK]VFK68249.1 MAG: Tubulin like [Candidatus Kentron sp. UNK]